MKPSVVYQWPACRGYLIDDLAPGATVLRPAAVVERFIENDRQVWFRWWMSGARAVLCMMHNDAAIKKMRAETCLRAPVRFARRADPMLYSHVRTLLLWKA